MVVNRPISHHCVDVVTIGRDGLPEHQALDVVVEVRADSR